MSADHATAADESLDAITDALLTAARLLVSMSVRSIGQVDEAITIPQFRTLVILSNRGPVNLATLAGLLGVQPSATGRMVDRLRAGAVVRPPPPPALSARTARRADQAWPRGRSSGHRVPAGRNRDHRGENVTTGTAWTG